MTPLSRSGWSTPAIGWRPDLIAPVLPTPACYSVRIKRRDADEPTVTESGTAECDTNHPMKLPLHRESLLSEAARFAKAESAHHEPTLFRVTDGKTVGTYLEHKFKDWLTDRYAVEVGSAAQGIDFPGLNTDMKATSAKQPQSSSPF